MKNQKTILCDADDVIENLLECWLIVLNSRFGTNVKVEDITEWGVSPFFPHLTEKQVYDPLYEDDLYLMIERIPGCYHVLKAINDFHKLYIVTASNFKTLDTKVNRIIELYPFLNPSQFIITNNKQMVIGDYLIDNGIHNVINGSYQGILYDMPLNRNFDHEKNQIVRVHNWFEIADLLL